MYVSFTAGYLFCEVWDWTSSKLENRRKKWENLSELVQETSRKSCEPSQWGFPFFSDAFWCSMSIVLRRRNESCNTFFIMLIVRYLLNSLPLSVEINLQLLTHVSNKTKTETFSRSSRQLNWCTLHTDPPNSKSGDELTDNLTYCVVIRDYRGTKRISSKEN